jgi:hypothetical protein
VITCTGQRDDTVQPHLVEITLDHGAMVAIWVIARNVADVVQKVLNADGLNQPRVHSVEEWPAHARRDFVPTFCTVL